MDIRGRKGGRKVNKLGDEEFCMTIIQLGTAFTGIRGIRAQKIHLSGKKNMPFFAL